MNKQMVLLTAVVCVAGLAAAEALEQPQVSVYGTAEIKVVPNEMVWSLNVGTKDTALPAVAKKQVDAVKQVLDLLKELGIEEKKLQTSQMQFGENWKTVDRERVRDGYSASTSVSFTISDFDLYQKIWFGLAEIESVSIGGTSYTHSDRIRYQNESRQQALLAAREKAIAMAATLGSQIAEPLSIEEVSEPTIAPIRMNRSNSSNFESAMGGSYASGDMLALGTISVSTRVRVVFKLKNP